MYTYRLPGIDEARVLEYRIVENTVHRASSQATRARPRRSTPCPGRNRRRRGCWGRRGRAWAPCPAADRRRRCRGPRYRRRTTPRTRAGLIGSSSPPLRSVDAEGGVAAARGPFTRRWLSLAAWPTRLGPARGPRASTCINLRRLPRSGLLGSGDGEERQPGTARKEGFSTRREPPVCIGFPIGAFSRY